MADSDDDLPPPPAKKPPVVLPDTDDDDDLPPPPQAPAGKPAAKAPVVVLTDSDSDDLPPPPPAAGGGAAAGQKKVVLPDSESDDDLPPPPGKPAAAAADASDDDLPPPPAKPGTAAAAPAADEAAAPVAARTRSRHVHADPGGDQKKERRQTTVRRNVNDISFKGYLLKQSPTWPYTPQKRWCVLKGRVLNYFESETSHTPAGTLDLKGAQLVDVGKSAKMPNSFGLTGPSGQLKARTYIFAAVSREEYQPWINVLEQVMLEPKVSELHWFDKMAQAIF